MYLAEGLWMVDGLRAANVYLLSAAGGAVIVDAGVGGSTDAILVELRRAGWTASDVRALVVTHAHIDHVGGLPELQQRTGAPIYAHGSEIAAIEGRAPLPHPPGLRGAMMRAVIERFRPPPLPVQHALAPGASLPMLPDWWVVPTPGHTPDHVSLYRSTEQWLLAGDALMSIGGLHRSPWVVTSDRRRAAATVAMLAALPLRNMAFGHGQPVRDDAQLPARLAQLARDDRSRFAVSR